MSRRETDELIQRALRRLLPARSNTDTSGTSPQQQPGPASPLPSDHHAAGSSSVSGAGRSDGDDTAGRVLLVIAHRIDTVMDADHLLVLGAGVLLEQGAPRVLAGAPGGVFHGMVRAARAAALRHHAVAGVGAAGADGVGAEA